MNTRGITTGGTQNAKRCLTTEQNRTTRAAPLHRMPPSGRLRQKPAAGFESMD